MPSLISAVKMTSARISPEIVLNFSVLRISVLEGLTRERIMATLSGFFGILAAVLAMIGLYGVISFMVISRRTELGIRMALGANRSDVLLAMTARSLFFDLSPTDPLTFAVASATLALTALLASFIPARRAANADPMRALREE